MLGVAGPCTPAEARCTFKTAFGGWGLGHLGQLRIDGAPIGDTTAAESDVATVETSVRGIVSSTSVTGTIR